MRRPERAKPDINVTPLVDVVLVLLIIFMVIIPQMQAGANVDVPAARNPDKKTDVKNKPITVSVTAAGNIYIEKSQVTDRNQFVSLLKQGHAASPGSRMILKGDKQAPYGMMRTLFKEAQTVGFPGVSLQVGDMRPGEGA